MGSPAWPAREGSLHRLARIAFGGAKSLLVGDKAAGPLTRYAALNTAARADSIAVTGSGVGGAFAAGRRTVGSSPLGFLRERARRMMSGDSKASRLAEEFQRQIDTQAMPPGAALGTKAAILRQHGVSAGTLNEALRLLQVQDYVVVRPGPKGGVFVGQKRARSGLANLLLRGQEKPQNVNDVLHIQDALQGLVAAEAATGCDAQQAAAIERALDRLSQATTPWEIFEANWDVDREIARAGNNHILAEMYCSVVDAIQSSIRWFKVEPEMAEGARRIHVAMARAVLAHDVEGASAAALLHSPVDGTGPVWRFSEG